MDNDKLFEMYEGARKEALDTVKANALLLDATVVAVSIFIGALLPNVTPVSIAACLFVAASCACSKARFLKHIESAERYYLHGEESAKDGDRKTLIFALEQISNLAAASAFAGECLIAIHESVARL